MTVGEQCLVGLQPNFRLGRSVIFVAVLLQCDRVDRVAEARFDIGFRPDTVGFVTCHKPDKLPGGILDARIFDLRRDAPHIGIDLVCRDPRRPLRHGRDTNDAWIDLRGIGLICNHVALVLEPHGDLARRPVQPQIGGVGGHSVVRLAVFAYPGIGQQLFIKLQCRHTGGGVKRCDPLPFIVFPGDFAPGLPQKVDPPVGRRIGVSPKLESPDALRLIGDLLGIRVKLIPVFGRFIRVQPCCLKHIFTVVQRLNGGQIRNTINTTPPSSAKHRQQRGIDMLIGRRVLPEIIVQRHQEPLLNIAG